MQRMLLIKSALSRSATATATATAGRTLTTATAVASKSNNAASVALWCRYRPSIRCAPPTTTTAAAQRFSSEAATSAAAQEFKPGVGVGKTSTGYVRFFSFAVAARIEPIPPSCLLVASLFIYLLALIKSFPALLFGRCCHQSFSPPPSPTHTYEI